MKVLSFFLFILLSGCSSISPGHFSLSIAGETNKIAIGDTLFFSLSNPKEHNLNDLHFSLNGRSIDDQYTIIESLGNQRLVADFKAGSKPFSIQEQFVVFADKAPDIYTYKLINTYPHDKNSYTQGLEFYQGVLYESTGQYGLSSIRKTAFTTGEVIQKLSLDASYFGEGLTFINDQAVQLTWKENLGFIYDPNNFKLLRSFNYDKSKEGWGLCNDGAVVYKTDGTEKLWKLDPTTFTEIGYVDIVTHNKLISKVNELEYANGLIYANTYQFNKEVVLIIKPASGQVVGVVDFSGLKEQVTQHPQLDVFNGIAYHPKRNSFFVTGKYWDKLFEVEIVKKE
ncbi:MAG: glutaminyl-peptide cyclotransferase [Flavobacteriaceae bacterium]|nr:glutaminyl-peptide cyclotransferase [Flavobacteriaceae bacterium]